MHRCNAKLYCSRPLLRSRRRATLHDQRGVVLLRILHWTYFRGLSHHLSAETECGAEPFTMLLYIAITRHAMTVSLGVYCRIYVLRFISYLSQCGVNDHFSISLYPHSCGSCSFNLTIGTTSCGTRTLRIRHLLFSG